eukprot:TRINITY_DN14323_c0_g1_i1.p2 TRINITY_DN14323_c0_g1~~TRINITY_DN14323_c0_g1_i1.p2  ORF type:complete len:183 (-),score=39.10 TRINITY_DN14323_c0_g1_i1:101-649(-)
MGKGVGDQIFCFFFNDTATTEIYTRSIVGSVRCVQETGINAEYMGMQRQQKDLQTKPNARLTGASFDAKHLDRFLQTEYGDKGAYMVPPTPPEQKGLTVGVGKGLGGEEYADLQQRTIQMQSNVRPDPCFLTVPRQMRKDANHGVNEKPMGMVHRQELPKTCLLYTSPSPRDLSTSRMPSSA